MNEEDRRMLQWLLDRIANWTTARWDQWLRYEFGDEKAGQLIETLRNVGIMVRR